MSELPSNPFPGPQPYRPSDRGRFYGREAVSADLTSTILAHRCVALYGPSGAGKSSVMQAGVLPHLEEEFDFRHVAIDGWPGDESPVAWLLYTLHTELKLSPPTAEIGLYESVEWTVKQAFRRSDRPILIYLDQLEQLLLPGRDVASVEDFLDWLDRFAERPIRGLHLVLAMREDYLGRFRDRARGRHRLLEDGFRLGPMSVREIVGAVCRAASDGVPPQRWAAPAMRDLMLQVRIPGQRAVDEAEVQTAFAQIVCRALFAERAAAAGEARAEGPVQAEPILFRYLESTIEGLGALRGPAEALLEDHLIAADGTRTLLTEEAARASGLGSSEDLDRILTDLERAAILRAEQHRGTRYFELGHDWLAKKVFDRKQERLGREAERERERQRAVEAAAAAAQLERARAEARRARRVVAIVTAFALIAVGLGVFAFTQQQLARAEAERAGKAERVARAERDRADEARGEAVAAKQRAEDSLAAEAEARRAASAAADEARRQQEIAEEQRAIAEEQREAAVASEQRAQQALAGQRRATAEAERQRQSALENLDRAEAEGRRARDANRLAVALSVLPQDPTAALALLREVEDPVNTRGWIPATVEALHSPSSQAILRGHRERVVAARFSRDGERVATASGGDARVERLDGKAPPVVLRGPGGRLVALVVAADGASVISAASDGAVLRWRAGAADEPQVLVPPGEPTSELALSPDGATIAVGLAGGGVRLLAADGRGAARRLDGHSAAIRALAFSPDGRALATASDDRRAMIWPLGQDGAAPAELLGHQGTVYSIRFSGDGKRVITASDDRSAKVWDARAAARSRPEPLYTLAGHRGAVFGADLSPRGDRAVTASQDRSVRLWTLTAGAEATSVPLEGHADKVYDARFDPRGEVVASASRDGTARIWTVGGGGGARVLRGHAGPVTALEFSRDGARLVTASEDGSARVWSVADAHGETVLWGHGAALTGVDVDADGGRLITGAADGGARVWTLRGEDAARMTALPAEVGALLGVTLRSDGGEALVGGRDGKIEVWRLPAGRAGAPARVRTVDLKLPGPATFLAIRGDGRWAVTSTSDVALLVDLQGGARVELRGHGGKILGAAFSADGKRVVTVSDDRSARVWGIDGRSQAVLVGHEGSVHAASFSRDGRHLVTASWDRTARVWALGSADPPVVLGGHKGPLRAAAFSPDGRRVITASDDGTARVWAADGRADAVTLYGHAGPVVSARFTPDGMRAVTISTDQSARVWDVDFDDPGLLRRAITETTTVCLAPAQRIKLLGEASADAERRHAECEAGAGRPTGADARAP